ncbi:NotI family restriction endonuclease [Glycocaulis abyssi]|uniref:NotI family restriction endonuclease n=1 Tax=Glycocaulis abyssi TaxID=1433403 RepID=UPI00352A8B91
MLISEIFGFGVDNQSPEARSSRSQKRCPFRSTACTKASKSDPIGICSLSDGNEAASLCPVRFLEGGKVFRDAAHIAFGEGAEIAVFPEIRILKVVQEGQKTRKIGKVDFLIGKIESDRVADFAAIEVQAVYFSGGETRSPMKHYLQHGTLDIANSDRRPDFRLSAQKRLAPQLQLKVPVFRRWGKKFFVVVDSHFFASLPSFKSTTASNSEVTWLSYPIAKSGDDYTLGAANVVYSEWDEIQTSLREGTPPEPADIILELQTKLDSKKPPLRIKS